ncbi:hypothetical protein D3C81_1256170 [compost metagenome]
MQGVGVAAVLGLDVGARVHVGRGAVAFGDGRQAHAFREQLAVAVVESVHLVSLLRWRLLGLGLQLGLLRWRRGRLGFWLVLVRRVRFAVIAIFRQIQRAFLATGRNEAGNSDQRREGGNQALHG